MEYLAKCDDENKNRQVATTVVQAGESKITDMASAISTTTAEWVEATAIREKESTVFVASEEALVATVDTVGRAINIIAKDVEERFGFDWTMLACAQPAKASVAEEQGWLS